MDSLKHYLSVYREYLATSFTKAMSFRSNFLLLIILELVFMVATLLPVSFIYDHVENIGPWNKNQLLFFIAYTIVVDNIHMTFFSESFWEFSFDIRRGQLDFTLLKPIGSIFCVFFRYIRPSTMLSGLVCWSILIFYSIKLNFSIGQYLLLPLFIMISTLLRVQLEFIVSTAMFYLTAGHGINFLRMQISEFASWPNYIYGNFTKKFLTFIIPVLLYSSAPTHFLFDFSNYSLLVVLFITVILTNIILRKLWQISLNHYNSASS